MTGSSNTLDSSSIIRILPQKPPAVYVDRVVELSPGERILIQKNVSMGDPCLEGHFPGFPRMPGTALLEIMIQACCLLAYSTERYDPSKTVVSLMGISKTKFRRTIGPGDTFEVEARLSQKRSNVWRFDVNGYEKDRLVVDGKLVLSLHGRDATF